MEQNSNKSQPDAKTARRPCLACGAAFAADSPYLRICRACKESEEWQSGNADFTLHETQERKAANDN